MAGLYRGGVVTSLRDGMWDTAGTFWSCRSFRFSFELSVSVGFLESSRSVFKVARVTLGCSCHPSPSARCTW